MGARASTSYSFVVGVDKPAGMTSHDVVNACRRIYGERRIGHTGTLDPAATGALAVCVGPATRLDRFLTGHSKTYEFTVLFGVATTTDDAQGEIVRTAPVPADVSDEAFAAKTVAGMVGRIKQLPPVYSAVKVGGKRSYQQARAGNVIDLSPRDVEVYSAQLIGVDTASAHAPVAGAANPEAFDSDAPCWTIRAHVSSGTYVRSLARDMGMHLGTCAHVLQLRRIAAGNLDVADCVTLEALERAPFGHLLDPVRLLGMRFLFASEHIAAKVATGAPFSAADVELFSYGRRGQAWEMCACTSGVMREVSPLALDETIGIVYENELVALYAYDGNRGVLKSACGFSQGVKRG